MTREQCLENPGWYMTVGDLDKPFDRPECSCERCEAWRRAKGRATHKECETAKAAARAGVAANRG